jgi:hypothetical protein
MLPRNHGGTLDRPRPQAPDSAASHPPDSGAPRKRDQARQQSCRRITSGIERQQIGNGDLRAGARGNVLKSDDAAHLLRALGALTIGKSHLSSPISAGAMVLFAVKAQGDSPEALTAGRIPDGIGKFPDS